MYQQTLIKSLLCLLVIVGAINWGYIAITQNCEEDLVNAILPAGYSIYVYAAVGLAGLGLVAMLLMKRGNLVEQARYAGDKALAGGKSAYRAIKKKVSGK